MNQLTKAVLISAGIMLALAGCTESTRRDIKTTVSEWTGGMNRTITAYDYTGKPIKSWKGKVDIAAPNSGPPRVLFDINGKRVIIYNAIVIAEQE